MKNDFKITVHFNNEGDKIEDLLVFYLKNLFFQHEKEA